MIRFSPFCSNENMRFSYILIISSECNKSRWSLHILQNDNITISWDFFRLTAPAAMLGHLGAVSLKKSHDIVISSFCNKVKGQANYWTTFSDIRELFAEIK